MHPFDGMSVSDPRDGMVVSAPVLDYALWLLRLEGRERAASTIGTHESPLRGSEQHPSPFNVFRAVEVSGDISNT